MNPNETPTPAAPSDTRAKARILLPIAGAVIALVVFLALFWNQGQHGKKGHGIRGGAYGQRDAHNPRGSGGSPVGGGYSSDDDVGGGNGDGEGNAAVTGNGSPVGGKRTVGAGNGANSGGVGGNSNHSVESGWWYRDDGKPAGTGSKANNGRESPVGGD